MQDHASGPKEVVLDVHQDLAEGRKLLGARFGGQGYRNSVRNGMEAGNFQHGDWPCNQQGGDPWKWCESACFLDLLICG
jgi:hypothetical protein